MSIFLLLIVPLVLLQCCASKDCSYQHFKERQEQAARRQNK